MMDSRVVWVVDTSILVTHLRSGIYNRFITGGLRNRSIFLPGVVLCELFAGAVTRNDRSDLEAFRRALGPHLLPTAVDDWVLAGRCLARYSSRWGRILPRDHLADALIAVTASKFNARLATENLTHMVRWQWVLRKLGRSVGISRISPDR